MGQYTKTAALALIAASLTACAAPAAPGATAPPGPGGGAVYACHDRPVPLDALTAGRPATELGPDGLAALKGEEVRRPRDLERWRIVEEGPERVALIAGRDPDARYAHPAPYRYLLIERFGPPGPDGRPGWHLRSSGGCDLRRELDGLGKATLALGKVSGRTVELLVNELACAGGAAATGRIRVVTLEEDEREVRVVIGVAPRSGQAMTCQANPPTPFTVELAAPLGGRPVMDAGVHPVRRVSPPR
ncbi:hypothetical protein [Nonomuraea typhae]|uniref:hypothetical protein n=1 Tax=Nonomuraea typhae TaxID=2603600 RepID=UPI0012F79118|nr:hypothetical protein [Nonomuraea typhae]